MKIVHVCLAGLYMSGWGYQDNLIAKYHVKMGHEVSVIANRYVYDSEGNYIATSDTHEKDVNGVEIIRLKQVGGKKQTGPAMRIHYEGLYDTLLEINPDVIFVHNPQILDADDIAKYMKNNNLDGKKRLYVDSHSDYSNSGRNFISKHFLHGVIWRRQVKKLVPYTSRFYGVLPARVDFLLDRYHTPKDKTELLVMGMDDEKAEAVTKDDILKIKKTLGIGKNDFFIVTGGKIDSSKTQTLLLMDAVHSINQNATNNKVRLLVFGSVTEELRDEFIKKCDYEENDINNILAKDGVIEKTDAEIIYIGWINSDSTYPYFASADMAIFPGRHSVMWEQVAGQGIPMAVRYWEGTTHVDVGGNCKFIMEDSEKEIESIILSLKDKGAEYQKMRESASGKAKEVFSYRKIAKLCIGE